MCDVSVRHDIDNISDHSILSLSEHLAKTDLMVSVEMEAKLLLSRASDEDLQCYNTGLDEELAEIKLDQNFLHSTKPFCNEHAA